MAEKKIKVKVDIETNAEGSINQLRALKKELKDAAAGSADFKRLSAEIRDMEDALEGAKLGADDFAGALEAAPGPVGQLFQGLKKVELATKSWGAALKATGIGLIVSLVGGLVAAFSQQEGAMKKLEPLLIGFQKIFNGIFRAIEPVFNYIVDLAVSAMPMLTKAFGVVYSALTSFLQGIGKLGSAIGKLIKGDFSGAWEDAKSSVTDFGKRYDAANKNFVAGTKEVTAIEKKQLEERNKNNEDALAKRKAAAEKAAAEAEKLRQEQLAKAKSADEVEIEAFKATLSEKERQEYEAGQKLAEQRKVLAAAGRTDMTAIEEQYRLKLKEIQTKYDDEEAKKAEDKRKKDEEQAEKDKEKLLKKQEEERGILLIGLQEKLEALDAENARIDGDFEADLLRLAEQKNILREQEAIELQNTELTEFQKTEIRKKYADARKGIVDDEIATEKAAAAAKQEINMAYLQLFEQFGNTLGQLAGKNKALAIAGIVISQAASIGQIIANTGIANAKAVAASPLTFGAPWVLINSISAGLSIAATIAGAVKSIQQINSAASQAGVTGGGGGGSVGAAPNIPTPRVGSTAAPTIQTGGGMNPTTQIGQTIAASQSPIKAYVVSGEVSSQQALDRRTSRAATFSGG